MKYKVISSYKDEYSTDGLYYNHTYVTAVEPGRFISHHHVSDELIFIVKGSGRYTAEGSAVELKEGLLIYVPPFCEHKFDFEAGCYYERYNIVFGREELSRVISDRLKKEFIAIETEPDGIIPSLFKKLDHYAEYISGDEYYAMIKNTVEEVIVNISISDAQNVVHDTQWAKIYERLGTDIAGIHTLDELCASLYVTKSTLSRMFIKHTGVPPKTYINDRKLALAHSYIKGGDNALTASIKSGFTDYSTFFRAFKKRFGYPPTEARSDKDVYNLD